MSTRQRERLASESAEEREARLQQMRATDWPCTESAEEREARLQQIRDRLTCVCAVAKISTYRRCAPVLTIWTLASLYSFVPLYGLTQVEKMLIYGVLYTNHVIISATTWTVCL